MPFIKPCANVYVDPYARRAQNPVDMNKVTPQAWEELNIELHPCFLGKMRDVQGLPLLPLPYSLANKSFPS